MRIYKYTLYLLFTILLFGSCNDDFFNQVPNDRITIEQVFERRQYSEEYLANVYSYIKDESHRTDGYPWDPCSDDLDVTYDRPGYNSYLMNLGNWNASSNYYEFWSHFYKGIRSATYFMNHIEQNKEMIENGEYDLIIQYKAEARFLRGWFYYNLLRQYGPFVIIGDDVIAGDLEPTDVKMNLARSSYDECVNYIIQELDEAAKDLPRHFIDQGDRDYGRATQVMCMATKSRVLLLAASPQFNGNSMYNEVKNLDGTPLFNPSYDAQKWKRASDAAKEIIDLGIFDLHKVKNTKNELDPYLSCRNVFLDPWNNEVIMARIGNYLRHWERSATPRQASGYESMGVTQQLVDAFEMNDGKGISETGTGYVETGFSTADYKDPVTGHVFAPKGVRNMYVNREPRFYVNVAFNGGYWIGDQKTQIQLYYQGKDGKKGSWDHPRTGYIANKNVHPNSDIKNSKYVARPFVMIRYAEILLNYIEALNEYDASNADIKTYLDDIRERAGLPAVASGLNQDQMRERIRHERRVELCLEQSRYFDTRRWLIAEQTDGGPFWGMNMDAGNTLTDEGFYQRTIFETRVFRKSYYLFPIPQSELDRDKQIVQNFGW